MKELKKYYRQVQKWLPCGVHLKKQLMKSIIGTIERYLSENPGVDVQQLQAHFGTPQQIAAAYVDEMDTKELLKALYIRRKVLSIVITVAMIILIIWVSVATAAYLEAISNINGFGVVEIY